MTPGAILAPANRLNHQTIAKVTFVAMRRALNFVTFCVSLCIALLGTRASARDNAAPTLLSADQGQALADFALRSGPTIDPQPDCSHLVHMLYAQAGLRYSYQGSRVLHRGAPDFARVKKPHPGDLIVWMGHVGIVLSPEDTTFLSSVRSGIITESWTNDYWTARGRPRFFRYVVGPKADLALLEEIAQQQDRRVAARPAPPQRPAEAGWHAGEADSPATSLSNVAGVESVIFLRQRGKANKIDVAAALQQDQLDLARRLIGGDRLDSTRPLSVVDHLAVTRIEVAHGTGTIRVQFSETLSLEQGTVLPGRTVERELKLNLRDGVWVISDPEQRLYIPREQAIDIFEIQAELVMQRNTVSTDKHTIIKALALLYDREPPIASAQARNR